MKNYRLLSIVILLPLILTACSQNEKLQEWKEEVKLSNGDVVIVERRTQWIKTKDDWKAGLQPKKTWVRFPYPKGSNQKVEWLTHRMEENMLRRTEIPIYFDYKNNMPYVITINNEKLENQKGAPSCIYYTQYQLQDSKWQEVALPEKFEKFSANLYVRIYDKESAGLLTADWKARENNKQYVRAWIRNIGPERRKCVIQGVNRPW